MLAAISYRACLSRNGYVNREGLREVVIDVYQLGGQRVTLGTAVRVKEQDFRLGKVQPSNPDYDLLNRKIRRLIRRLMEHEDELEASDVDVTPKRIRSAYLHHQIRTASLQEWVESVIEPSKRKANTKAGYRTLVSNIEEYQHGVCLRDLCYDWLERWENWMRNTKHLSENTITGKLKALRCLVSEAIKRDVIRKDDDPFKAYSISEFTARKEYLTLRELKRIAAVKIEDPKLGHVRDGFLFCCATGLRWGDFKALTSESLQGKTLVVDQLKTGHLVHIPIDTIFWGMAMGLIEKYGSLESLADVGCNSYANARLREVATMAGIKKHCHWHLARHTCGTLLNQRSLLMQEIQHILGHQKQSTTEKYYAFTAFEQVKKSVRKAFK